MTPALECRSVAFAYPDGHQALFGVDLVIEPGERVALLGPNGAGKTTLVLHLNGIHVAGHGEVLVTGLPVTKANLKEVRRRVGIVFQDPDDQLFLPTVGEDVAFGPANFGVTGDALAARVDSALAAVGMSEHKDRSPLHLSGGQRRRVELARILFSGAETLLLDEPTNHLDADSIGWLREFLVSHKGGLVVISHDVSLLDETVTRVFHLDANRAEVDVYNVGWRTYLQQRETDERRRKRERANAEKKATSLFAQADKMRAKATKAVAAQNMARRAERLLSGLEAERRSDKVARISFPSPAPCGKTPLTASELSKTYGSLEVFTDVDLAVDKGSRVVVLGLNGAGKTTLLRILAELDEPDTGAVVPGYGLKLGYYAQEHETLDLTRTVLENLQSAAPALTQTQARSVLGSFLFSGDDADKPAAVLSGGEKTRLALATLVVSAANVLLLDEPTNNLDPASREEVLAAIRRYEGAIILVTHDEGAVTALQPDRVLILPDGVEDLWSDEYADLVALA